jgi:predicted Zn-dependent protease
LADEYQLSADDREHMLAVAVEHYEADRLDQAEKVLRGLIAVAPKEVRAWQLLGSVLAVQGYRVAAQEVFKRAQALAPDDLYTLAALAEMALDALRWEDAKPLLSRLFELDPKGEHPAANRARERLAAFRRKLGG